MTVGKLIDLLRAAPADLDVTVATGVFVRDVEAITVEKMSDAESWNGVRPYQVVIE